MRSGWMASALGLPHVRADEREADARMDTAW